MKKIECLALPTQPVFFEFFDECSGEFPSSSSSSSSSSFELFDWEDARRAVAVSASLVAAGLFTGLRMRRSSSPVYTDQSMVSLE